MTEREKEISKAGEIPGKGLYICITCGQSVGIDDETHALPLCPQCSHTEYRKVQDTK